MNSDGNTDILVLDDELANCFGTSVVYKKNILDHCRPHIFCVMSTETGEIKKKTIETMLRIDVPTELITKDPSSLFWLQPFFASLIAKTHGGPLYTWNECFELFLQFSLHTPEHIINIDENMFEINPTSHLTNLFKFKYFHKDQIPIILQQITRFIYKPTTLLSLCPNLTFDELSSQDPIFSYIEHKIKAHSRLIPFTPHWIYI